MWCFAVICMSLVSISCGDLSPIYSPSYAHVYYQATRKYSSEFNTLDTKEEVTELPQFDEVNPTVDSDTATEPYSENINFTKIHKSQGPKKINEAIELSEELDPTTDSDLEPTDSPVLEEQGFYYVYHPSGLLQRVVFTKRNDFQRMEYLANANYQDVEPIVDPIYIYDPSTLLFQRLQVNLK